MSTSDLAAGALPDPEALPSGTAPAPGGDPSPAETIVQSDAGAVPAAAETVTGGQPGETAQPFARDQQVPEQVPTEDPPTEAQE